ncbi:LacI family DNA-binding transcriptional regulator [Motiliproteus sp. MSK22-1]|uniref:LacI family DNA-binding transcriptional regulator n=1 Tax=Motiliproteus sp. MSK22-1 TaxID=1897630 RepID=UPI00097612BA|nr:LacI family DNA-binding transcriptional regulator [Motiliproteus sp. MSK22-1]OMH38844.1 hypothetical protein BGP75_00240 [Motiliproteus sp. MSK22-1]
MKKSISIIDVAKSAGVSSATVSNVFSGKKPVSDELAKHVRSVADQLGYSVNRTASVLRSGRSKIVGILVPDLSDHFFTSIITEIERIAGASGYEIIVGNSNNDVNAEERRLNALLSWRPAGMAVFPCSNEVPGRVLEERKNLPFVIADRFSGEPEVDTVAIDNLHAGSIVANCLAEFGHQRVLLLGSDLELEPIRLRCEGARREIEQSGGVAEIAEVGANPHIGAERLGRWLDSHDRPTAICAMTDMVTLAILSCFAQRGIKVGEDISLIGFDDYLWMSARMTPLTAVCQPVEAIAQSVWDCLNARMNGDDSDTKHIVHRCSLSVRESTRPAGNLNIQLDKTS